MRNAMTLAALGRLPFGESAVTAMSKHHLDSQFEGLPAFGTD